MLRKAMFATLLAVCLSSTAYADTLLVEGIRVAGESGHPARGSSKADVLAQFGEPAGRSGPVGEPPISSWEYEAFVVYFEYDYALHAVAKRQ